MLVLTRTNGQSIFVSPSVNIPHDMTVAELFANGPIEIGLRDAKIGQAKITICAPNMLIILREEILE